MEERGFSEIELRIMLDGAAKSLESKGASHLQTLVVGASNRLPVLPGIGLPDPGTR